MDQLKKKMRESWMAGDFGQIARFSAQAAEEFVDRLAIHSGMQVIDVACGTGNLAIPAARKGAHVTGLDIAPNLLEQARNRAAAEGLHADFEEGDAEELPYPDAHFDIVMSMFGAMFAPRPERVAAQFARVCRSGGRIAMANWTAEGFVGKMLALGGRYAPPPPGILAPALWGDEENVRERLGPVASRLSMVRRAVTFDYPFPPRDVVQFFRDYFGPTKVAFSRLDSSAQQAYAADLEHTWLEQNEADGERTLVRAEYLEVVAIRA
jgi:SAM-dependent methyltransferase